MRSKTKIRCPRCGRVFEGKLKFRNVCPYCRKAFYAWEVDELGAIKNNIFNIEWFNIERVAVIIKMYGENGQTLRFKYWIRK